MIDVNRQLFDSKRMQSHEHLLKRTPLAFERPFFESTTVANFNSVDETTF